MPIWQASLVAWPNRGRVLDSLPAGMTCETVHGSPQTLLHPPEGVRIYIRPLRGVIGGSKRHAKKPVNEPVTGIFEVVKI